MDFLTKIIATRRERVQAAKAKAPIEQVRVRAEAVRGDSTPRRFAKALRNDSKANIIAEFKRRSPSQGDLNIRADAAAVARTYESAGAAAISVLTEEDFFGGSLADLERIREAVSIPILRKDFIVDEYQVYESAAAGADAFLLIVAALDDATLARLRTIGEDRLGMNALVEVHTKDELDRAVKCGANLIGVNNRNLHTFELSTAISDELARVAPHEAILVSESGLSPEEVNRLRALGYKGFLVGEALMRAKDPASELRNFIGRGLRSVRVKICGITNLEDARAAIDAGADMLGFNFFRRSPRFVEPQTAREIIDAVRARLGGSHAVMMIGVFVNESIEEICRIADDVRLDGVQLHGEETIEFCAEVKKQYGQGVVFKALPGSDALDLSTLSEHPADAILLDAFDKELRGGTGRTADWVVAREAAKLLPTIILAGGLSPENVADAIARVQPDAVDACSALETAPGKKNAERMREFVNAVRASKLQAEPDRPMAGEGN